MKIENKRSNREGDCGAKKLENNVANGVFEGNLFNGKRAESNCRVNVATRNCPNAVHTEAQRQASNNRHRKRATRARDNSKKHRKSQSKRTDTFRNIFFHHKEMVLATNEISIASRPENQT